MNFWERLFLNGLKKFPYGSIQIEWPNGKIKTIKATQNGPKASLKIYNKSVFKEIIRGGSVKFAELYISKKISSNNLTKLIHYFALNNDQAENTFDLSLLKTFYNKLSFFMTCFIKYKEILRNIFVKSGVLIYFIKICLNLNLII